MYNPLYSGYPHTRSEAGIFPFCAQTNDPAPLFIAEAYDNSKKTMNTVNLETYRGKWVILFFYSSDFTFV
ncbi:redoxin domain-containing protein [Bacillus sp. NTK074B]|nr:redoxin domain-containing protein [Bacillus sp. NTK074B]